MRAEVFVDTNVFLYSISVGRHEVEMRERALQILRERDWGWSVQVAGEFFNSATAARRPFGLSSAQALAFLDAWFERPTIIIEPATVMEAIGVQQRYGLSYWDSLIVAAGRELGCTTLCTEDLNDGQDYGGIRVENPFPSL